MRFSDAVISLILPYLALSTPIKQEVPAYDNVLDTLTKTICLCTTPAHQDRAKDEASAHVTYDYQNFQSNENHTITTRCEPRRKKKHKNTCWVHPETVLAKNGPSICDDGEQDSFCIDSDGYVRFRGERRSMKHVSFIRDGLPEEVTKKCEATCEREFGFLMDRFDPGESSSVQTRWFEGIGT
ncbi:MAG: hypothetical protein Q9217_000015 [Psora testacea]